MDSKHHSRPVELEAQEEAPGGQLLPQCELAGWGTNDSVWPCPILSSLHDFNPGEWSSAAGHTN